MHKQRCVAAAAMSLLLASTAAVAAPSPQSTTVIIACYNVQNGRARIVSSTSSCTQGESYVVWNIRGPVGPQGPAGPAGPQGAAGPKGPRAFRDLPVHREFGVRQVPLAQLEQWVLPVLQAQPVLRVLSVQPAQLAQLEPRVLPVLPAPPALPDLRDRPGLRVPFQRISPHSPTTTAQTAFRIRERRTFRRQPATT